MKHQSLVQFAVALLCGSAAVTQAQNSDHSRGPRPVTPISLSVTSQPIAAALNDFARQSGLHVVIGSEVAAGVQSTLVNGTFTPEAALQELLRETGLRYEYLDSETVAVFGADGSRAEVRGDGKVWRLAQLNAALADGATDGGGVVQTSDGDANLEEGSTKNSMLEEVIVTAQKREQSLQDVPISISVMGGDELDASSFLSMDDALRTVPGLVMYESGQSGMSKIAIRGVSSNTSLLNGSSTVGYYVDEIPFAFVRFPFTPDVGSVYDLERVEVLRGPQGTLYGASSLNGVVRILTRDADLNEIEFAARTTASTTTDGDPSYRGDVSVNIPLVEGRLAVRGSVGYAEDGGWINQPPLGLNDVNSETRRNYRIKVNAAPTENLGVEFVSWITRKDTHGFPQSRDDRTTGVGVREGADTEMDAYGLTLTYDFPWASLISATSHLSFNTLTAINFLGTTNPADYAYTGLGSDLTAQEFRLTSRGEGPWSWSAGTIYRKEEDDHLFFLTSPGLSASFYGRNLNQYGSESYAVFGEVARSFFNDLVELTVGLRYFEDEAFSNEVTPLDPALSPYGRREDSFDALTPRFVLSYRPNDSLNLHASYSEGFRSGFSQNATVLRATSGAADGVDPDRLSNYEIGAKGSVFDGRVSYEIAAYYIDWEDSVQVYPTIFGPGLTANAATNSEGITGPGFDGALTLQITDRFTANATVSWNNLEFAEDVRNASNGIVFPRGSRPPESSEMTAGFGLDYRVDLSGDFEGRFSGGVNYIGAMVTPGATSAATLEGDSLTIARASFALVAPSGWTAMLFVDNLTDEDGRIRPASPTNPLAGSDRLRPRTYGLQLDYRFN